MYVYPSVVVQLKSNETNTYGPICQLYLNFLNSF